MTPARAKIASQNGVESFAFKILQYVYQIRDWQIRRFFYISWIPIQRKDFSCQGSPDQDFTSIFYLQKDLKVKKPGSVLVVETCETSEGGQVSLFYGGADGIEAFFETTGFGFIPEDFSRHATEDDVGGKEVDEDQSSLLSVLVVRRTEIVGVLQSKLGAEEVTCGEMEAAQVVQVCDLLWLWVHSERRR